MRRPALLCVPVLCLALTPGHARADEPEAAARPRAGWTPFVGQWERPWATVPRTDAPPVIDGRLDDEAWARAAVIDSFLQVEPIEGARPTERTSVYLMLDEDFLYIGVRAEDSDPGAIIARQMRRDADLNEDDRIAFVIDGYGQRRDGFYFEVGAAGGKRDALVENNRNLRFEWDGVWDARTAIDERGWTAEIRIPMKTLSFDPRAGAWGFNAERVIRRKNEVVRWATPSASSSLSRVSDAGVVEGFVGLSQGIGLDVKPSLTLRHDFDENSTTLKPSLDMFYRVTPNITAALTINTDFAETEVDERQINLTRFPLFFPEKRDFFLQDAGIFSFGGVRRTPLAYHSRRIGIVDGLEKDILAGMKLTGRSDEWTFGLMSVQMKKDATVGHKNLSVGRARFNFTDTSSVGLIATNGDPSTTGDNSLVGIDFDLLDPAFKGSNALQASGFYMRSFTSGSDTPDGGDGAAFGARIEYPNDLLSFSLIWTQIDEGFNPAMGFVSRRGEREYFANIRKRWRPRNGIRRIDLEARVAIDTNLDNETITADIQSPELTIENTIGDRVSLAYNPNRDVLENPFQIRPDVTIDPGSYDFDRFNITASTSGSRKVSGRVGVSLGEFYDGEREDYELGVTFRPGPALSVSADYIHNQIDLDDGDFITRIARGRVDISFTPQISWSNLIQYDNVSDTMGVNSRLRWEVTPGNDVFIVLNQGFTVEDSRVSADATEVSVKVGMTFRF